MSKNLEYQARFKTDTGDLKKAQVEISATGTTLVNMGKTAGGLTMVLANMRGAVSGNISSLVNMAVGAGLALKSLASLHPAVKILSIALAAGKFAYELFTNKQEAAAKKAEEAKAAIDALGLSISALDQHLAKSKDAADAYERIQKAAERTATAVKDLTAAQIAYNQAVGKADVASLDLEEAIKLSNSSLTPDQTRDIKREYAGKRAEVEARTVEDDFKLKFEQNQKDRFDIESGAGAFERDNANLLQGNIDDAKKALADIVAANAAKVVSSEDFSALPMDQRWKARMQREKEVKEEFAAEPMKAQRKYAPAIGEEGAGEIGDMVRTLNAHQKALSQFKAGESERQADTNRKLDVIDVQRKEIGLARNAALDSIKTGLVETNAGIAAESRGEASNKAAADAEKHKARDNAISAAGERARRAIETDRYDRMSDPEKAEHLRGKVKDTRSAIADNRAAIASETDPDKRAALLGRRGQLVEDLVSQRKEGRSVVEKIEKQRDADNKVKGGVDNQVAEHRDAIEKMRHARSEQSVDAMQVFKHMYAVKEGRNPDETIADNTTQMADHLSAIAEILKEAAK